MKPKISIIVPVYNVERYLTKCINSILSQSFKDFELILVHDGSTDNSLSICEKYTEMLPYLRKKENLESYLAEVKQYMDAEK